MINNKTQINTFLVVKVAKGMKGTFLIFP